jgi:hypothetical protein
MLMPQFMSMDMNMLMSGTPSMNMGAYSWMRDWQTNGGFGDTGAYALFKLWEGNGQHLHLTQGITAPTGTINTYNELDAHSQHLFSYDMQLGSGTWDYKPSLTYSGSADEIFWGGQLAGTLRLQNQNARGYALGDILQGTAWGGYQWNRWVSTTIRGVYTQQGAIKDRNLVNNQLEMLSPNNQILSMPDLNPQNYGGTFVDAGFGLTLSIPKGPYAGNSLSFEWLQPMYTYFNGYQLERTGALNATWGYMF